MYMLSSATVANIRESVFHEAPHIISIYNKNCLKLAYNKNNGVFVNAFCSLRKLNNTLYRAGKIIKAL